LVRDRHVLHSTRKVEYAANRLYKALYENLEYTTAADSEGLEMRPDKQNTKAFYRHEETGDIFCIEKRWDGTILGSSPAKEPLRDLDSYEYNMDNNLWLAEISDKLLPI
jgi:hypothetical protein